MRTPTIVNVRPPATIPKFVTVGMLDIGDLFMGSPATDPELCMVLENPRGGGLLQTISLETGNTQPMSKDIVVQQVTTVITVLGDTKL